MSDSTAIDPAATAELDREWVKSAAASLRHPLTRALLVLTLTTGLVDAVELPRTRPGLHRQHDREHRPAGLRYRRERGLPVVAPLVSLGSFLVGAVGGGLLAKRIGNRHPEHIARALGFEATLIGAAAVLAAIVDVRPSELSGDAVIAMLALGDGRSKRDRPDARGARSDDDRSDDDPHGACGGFPRSGRLRQGLRAQERGCGGDAGRCCDGRAAPEDEHGAAAGRGSGPRARHLARLRSGRSAAPLRASVQPVRWYRSQ